MEWNGCIVYFALFVTSSRTLGQMMVLRESIHTAGWLRKGTWAGVSAWYMEVIQNI